MGKYIYNGVEAPDINTVWIDKETHPFAYVCQTSIGKVIYLYLSAKRLTVNFNGALPLGSGSAWYEIVDGVWTARGMYPSAIPLIWSNVDVYYSEYSGELSGTIFLAASEPVPVVTAEPIDPKSYFMGFRLGQLLQGMRGRAISGETDVTEVILEDGILYIINAKAVQDGNILEVT